VHGLHGVARSPLGIFADVEQHCVGFLASRSRACSSVISGIVARASSTIRKSRVNVSCRTLVHAPRQTKENPLPGGGGPPNFDGCHRKWETVSSLSPCCFAVFLWGGSNTGTKFVVGAWPPIWTGCSRFLCAGLLLLVLLRHTKWLGERQALDRALRRSLWWRGGLSLAAYIVVFNSALLFVPVSHVVVYLGAAPIWALLWEGLPGRNWRSVRRYGAAALALCGVVVLFWPALKSGGGSWYGELLGLVASVLWTNYGRQCARWGQVVRS